MKQIYALIYATFFCFIINAQPTRNWGTYYGGSLRDEALSVVTDVSGNVYITGRTASTTGISTGGSHQPVYGGGSYDFFLAKFNSAGVIQWADR